MILIKKINTKKIKKMHEVLLSKKNSTQIAEVSILNDGKSIFSNNIFRGIYVLVLFLFFFKMMAKTSSFDIC